jgi:DNA-binding transcriptional regulator YhcF (GntR family)
MTGVDERFSIVPGRVLGDRGLSNLDVRVYGVIFLHASYNGDHRAWPSIATIAAATGAHRISVIRSVQALERAGHLTAERRPGLPTIYRPTPGGGEPRRAGSAPGLAADQEGRSPVAARTDKEYALPAPDHHSDPPRRRHPLAIVPWGITPRSILAAHASQAARLTWAYLATYCYGGNDCTVSVRTIAQDIGFQQRTIRSAISELERAGLIERFLADEYVLFTP